MTASAGQTGAHGPAGAALSEPSPAYSALAAVALLALMAWLLVSGAWGDSVTYDEQPHIAAGYTYLTRRTIDFNVEHPPLIKDFAALPLLFLPLDLGWEREEIAAGKTPEWPDGDPWEFGRKLLDHSGVDPEWTMFAARVPMIAVTLLLGWAVFVWTRRHYGAMSALLALALFVFSPTVLAHGRLVTTDVGAAAGFFIALTAYLRFLAAPTARNIMLAGVALGVALLAKFSTFLLVPLFVLMALAWALLHPRASGEVPVADAPPPRRPWGSPVRWTGYSGGTLLVALPSFSGLRDRATAHNPQSGRASSAPSRLTAVPRLSAARVAAVLLIGFALVYALYAHHIQNLPAERQLARAQFSLTGRGVGNTPKDITLWMTRHAALRPLGLYFSGLIQTMIRSASGGGVYLLGKFYPLGVPQYFPLVYLMKEPAALHLLTLLALLLGLAALRRARGALRQFLRDHFAVLALLLTAAAYWAVSVRSHLNIGVRHVMPVLPLTFALVGIAVGAALRASGGTRRLVCAGIACVLLIWQAVSVLRVQPYHMAYFNEFAGGPENGWQRVIDSNADWGQDMGRLAKFVNERGIGKLWLDYFGSSDANRYLPGKWEAINLCSPPQKGWVAVSVMFYQNSAAMPACDYRRWLPLDKLTAKVGYSTLIFHLE